MGHVYWAAVSRGINSLCRKRFLGTPFMYKYVLAVIVVAVAPVPYLSTLYNI
jgi:hypothetical protein